MQAKYSEINATSIMSRPGHNYSQTLFEWENGSFTIGEAQAQIVANCNTILALILFYLLLLLLLPKYFSDKQGYRLRGPSIVYNTAMSLFSFWGVATLFVQAVYLLKSGTFYETCCRCHYYFLSPTIITTYFFSMSKPIELIDTFILLLRRKEVIFLHWYHHVTVIIIAINNYVHPQPTGLWCGIMNYGVHFLMYGYYAIMLTPAKKLVLPLSIVITTLQILQMILATAIHAMVFYEIMNERDCDATKIPIMITGVIYFSYGFLFAQYFAGRYKRKTKKE